MEVVPGAAEVGSTQQPGHRAHDDLALVSGQEHLDVVVGRDVTPAEPVERNLGVSFGDVTGQGQEISLQNVQGTSCRPWLDVDHGRVCEDQRKMKRLNERKMSDYSTTKMSK